MTIGKKYVYIVDMKTYSTVEVAKLAGINKRTLYRWLWSGKISKPRRVRVAGRNFHIWTQRDLNRVFRHKQLHYRKDRGRKKKSKT